MEASFYPPRHQFNYNTYDDNLNLQHEALKRMMNSYENSSNHHTSEAEEKTIIEKMPAPIKIKRRTKKDIKDLMA
jgi:hypothetical protein